ncbi:DUF4132 domain-containing protein [Actinoplanes sp. NPDC089786]|uniref:DUF4132 domain-containing protein n=1 Tax=Actinoplanes sp. NPDC089786 TaxID=3155185 RepID=UPI00341F048F
MTPAANPVPPQSGPPQSGPPPGSPPAGPSPAGAVPPLLADPPWRDRRATAVVIAGLECADPAIAEWGDGEREEWLADPVDDPVHRSWDMLANRVSGDVAGWDEQTTLFVHGPDDVVRPMLAGWRPEPDENGSAVLRRVGARFEQDALPPLLYAARRRPADLGFLVLPFSSPGLAQAMAEGLSRKSFRGVARAWLGRHPAAAARALVPNALRKPGTPRRHAERALLELHDDGHGDAVRAAAAGYGAGAAAAIETLLATDRAALLPARMPAVPEWASPAALPPVRLRGGGALPGEAVGHLIQMVACSRLDDPYAGLEIVAADLDRASLAEFAWQLFLRWDGHGAAARENWALDALGLLGDDETVRRLTPMILWWPGRNNHAKAVTGVSVLAAIGSDVALTYLYRISRKAPFHGLKQAAVAKMEEVAAGLGLTAENLADRLVPDLGLSPDGTMTLDYGPRRFTVGFDEQLRPYVMDAGGKHLKALPKPGVKDDPELAPAAHRTFVTLKKEVRTVATEQLRRLERAMVKRRRWPAAEFRRVLVDHPLLRHITRRLVWGVYDTSGTLVTAFRVAEDRSLATVEDDETTIADDAIVGVAHPLEIGDRLPDWSEVLADYEILQPFPQLGRKTFTPTAEEVAAGRLLRFEGAPFWLGEVQNLEYRGWRRDRDAIVFDLAGRRAVVVSMGATTFGEIHLADPVQGRRPVTTLDPVTLSDVIRHLTEVSK